jgi:hypothetical protein
VVVTVARPGAKDWASWPVLVSLLVVVLVLAGCGAAGTPTPAPSYDLAQLRDPAGKYVGAALQGVPDSIRPLQIFTARIGRRPNMIEYFVGWGEGFDAAGARRVLEYGALPVISWEPYGTTLANVAAGKDDAYIRAFADGVRAAGIPIVISFGHEMNGDWFPWGAKTNDPASFVGAWRRIHDLFGQAGADKVIWMWSPNEIGPASKVALPPLYPGDSYVDWIGLIGYYRDSGRHTFETLFQPSIERIRQFTYLPIVIAETGAAPSAVKAQYVADLLDAVTSRPDVIGFVYLNYNKPGDADWRLEADPGALDAFKERIAGPAFAGSVNVLPTASSVGVGGGLLQD